MQILITGGMGFIGKAVTAKILEAESALIVILDNLSPKIHDPSAPTHDFGDPRVHFVRGDVSRREDIEPLLLSADIVLHLAAETGTGQSMYAIEHYNHVNISATALMLDILCNKSHQVKKFVIASSRAVYGEGKHQCVEHGVVYPAPRLASDMERGDFESKCPICHRTTRVLATSEDSLLHPMSFYGITKQMQESIVMTLCTTIGIAPAALRYQNVYGPGQSLANPYTGILSIFSNRMRSGKNVNVFEDGQESRDFVFIDDVADVTVKAIFSDRANGEVLNVGSGIPISVLKTAQTIKNLFSSSAEINVTGQYRVGDIRHNYADLTRVSGVLDWKPKINFDRGLSTFVDWVKQQPIGPDLYEQSISEMSAKGMHKYSHHDQSPKNR